MSEFDLNHVEPIYIDVLTELGNIGAGNAATSLAQMLNTQVKMTVPKVELLDFDKIGEAMGGEEQIMVGRSWVASTSGCRGPPSTRSRWRP